jgi:anti-sigma28 factor (negative regulator of flagellin synthesis)
MKINIQTNYGLFKNRKTESGISAPGQTSAPGTVHMDRDSITRGNTTIPDRQMLLLKSSVQSYVSAPADRARLDSIRESIQGGTYHIPTDQLVGAILEDGNGMVD